MRPLHAEVGLSHFFVGKQTFGRSLKRDAPGLHDIAAVGYLERLVRILLHEKHRGAVAVDLLDDVEDLLDDDGREAQRRLVQQQKPRAAHDGARDGEHLLFTAGQGTPCLTTPLCEDGKEVEDVIEVAGDAFLVATQKGPEVEVLLNGQVGKDETPFRDLADAQPHDLVGLHGVDGLSLEQHFTGAWRRSAADGHQRGALARAVGTDERDNLPLADGEVDVAQGLYVAVVGVDVTQLKHVLPLRGRP